MTHSKITRALPTLLVAGALAAPIGASTAFAQGPVRVAGSRVVHVRTPLPAPRRTVATPAVSVRVAPQPARIARPPMPPPRREARPVRPRHATAWASGQWRWNGRRYVWQPGHWVVTRPARRAAIRHPRPLPPRAARR